MKPVMQMNNQTAPSAESLLNDSPLANGPSSGIGIASTNTDWAVQSNLTAAQRQLWLGQKLSPDAPLYNMAFLFTFSGELEPTHFQAAFQTLVQRCDALRTVIEEVDGIPQQRVQDQMDYSLPVLEFRGEMSHEDAVRAWGEARSQTLFNLSERLFDMALLQCPGTTVWYLNQHHLITDMVSLKRLYEVMGELYARSLEGTLDQAPELPAYADVVLPVPTPRTVDYWQKQQISPCSLYHRSSVQSSARSSAYSAGVHESTVSRRISCVLTPEKTAALKTLAIESEAAALTPQLSLFNLVSGLVLAYLHRISGDPRVAFSTPSQGRPSKALKATIGVFIELFPLAVEVDPQEETFASLLTKVSEASGGFLRHAQPGASEFAPNREANVVLNFLTAKVSDFAGSPVRAEWLHSGASDPHHHLRILVHDLDDRGCLQLHFDFNNELFEPALQERAPSHFLALVDAVLADRSQSIAEVDLLSEAEKYRLDELGQSSQIPSVQGLASQGLIDQDSINQTVVQQFEAQVERTPDAIALICDNVTLTYRQLNAKANQLVHSLQHQAILPESPVALCFHRSPDMLVAIWGVLKAGGAYVPLEPSHPKERIAHILQDTRVQWVLSQSDLADRISGEAIVLTLDTLNLEAQPNHNPSIPPRADQLAYCLYTSGSTGKPKGVEIEHRSLLNYVQWAQQQYVRGRSLAFPLFSPLAFDLTVTSIYVPLTSGGQVVIYPEAEASVGTGTGTNSGATIDLSLQRIFQDNAVDVIKLTPSHLALVQGMSMGSRVKTLILGGEDLKTSLAKEIISQPGPNPDLEIYNEYGPTEATVGCMIQRFGPVADTTEEPLSVSIGKPAAGADIYLLDDHLNRVPWGDVGEIFIGGPGLARGYLNRPELSAERFVIRAGERLYRTGDLGRWEANGRLTYLGRCDRQVKLHGIRIELGEIEAAVEAHPQVMTCVAKVIQGGDAVATQLVAYFVQPDEQSITAAALRDFVAQRLPSAVRPAYFVALDRLPLTPNGKVDVAALPTPQTGHQVVQESFVAPRNPVENSLKTIWQQVLRSEKIGIYDNFFDLGGDSIMAIQIAARMSDAGWVISPNQIFQHATIAELASVAISGDDFGEGDSNPTSGAVEEPPVEAFSLVDFSGGQLDKLSTLLDQADQAGGDNS